MFKVGVEYYHAQSVNVELHSEPFKLNLECFGQNTFLILYNFT